MIINYCRIIYFRFLLIFITVTFCIYIKTLFCFSSSFFGVYKVSEISFCIIATRSFFENKRKVQEPKGKGKKIASQSQFFQRSIFKQFEKEYKSLESVVKKKV